MWSTADFGACLTEIAAIAPRLGRDERAEARALQARCYLRLDRPGDALDALGSEESRSEIDDRCTYASLRGLAILSTGRHGLGVQMLTDAVGLAEEHSASDSIRSEALYNLAFGLWMRGEYEAAEGVAVRAGRAATDIVAARGVALRGWIRIARAEFASALAFFQRALQMYASCALRDAAFHSSVVHAIATYDLLLLDRPEPLAYVPMLPRVPTTSLDTYGLLVGCVDAIRFALAGDEARAIESAVSTETLDVAAHWRVFGIALRARVAIGFGYDHYARSSAHAAGKLAVALDWDIAPAESRLALLDVAEVLSQYDVDRARALLTMYGRINTQLSPRYVGTVTPIVRSRELHAKGIVSLACGNASGEHMLLEAAALYESLGFHWRAAESRLGLRRSSPVMAISASVVASRAFVQERFPGSHLAREFPDFVPEIELDASRPLTPAQAEIVRQLCAGRSPRQIATMRGTSLGTVYNQLKAIYHRTELRSITDIVRTFSRREA
jgi:DNA-binding CsgD family transcriptional regulator/tetratricopeptide (TPR) repeat protein